MSVLRAKPNRVSRPRNPRAAAFYDLDGTLIDLNLVHAALFILANLGEWTRRVGYVLSFAARAPRLIAAEGQDRRLLNTVLFEAFKGVSEDRLFSLGEEYFERVMLKHLYPKGLDLVLANRAAGIAPVLVTGSPDFIAAPLARHLGITDCAANRLAVSRGIATGRLREPVMAADEKAAWCAQYAASHRLDLRSCWAYADSFYDLPVLAAVGHPVAVNPDRRLRAAAISRQWPIIRFELPAKSEQSSAETASDSSWRSSDGAS